VLAQVGGLEGQGATGVLLLRQTEDVARVADLSLDLLLAVTCNGAVINVNKMLR
jgi:hypothetical protein